MTNSRYSLNAPSWHMGEIWLHEILQGLIKHSQHKSTFMPHSKTTVSSHGRMNAMAHDIVVFFNSASDIHHLLKFTIDQNPGNYISGAPFYHTKAIDSTYSNVLETETYQWIEWTSYQQGTRFSTYSWKKQSFQKSKLTDFHNLKAALDNYKSKMFKRGYKLK